MIHLKSEEEIEIMKSGSTILRGVLNTVIHEAKEGISLLELDRLSENLIRKKGGESSFKRVPGYKWTICASVNDVVVHGIPTDYRLKKGDVLGIDCGVYYKGFHTDAAWSIIVGNSSTYPEKEKKDINDTSLSENEKFLIAGRIALEQAVSKVQKDNHIYDISKAIETNVEMHGYSVVLSLVGHGVGKELHEEPEIPGVTKIRREKTPKITAGMVLAVEVIYNLGSSGVVYKGNDGWTIATKDGTISGLFEATVAVTSHGAYVLTEPKARNK